MAAGQLNRVSSSSGDNTARAGTNLVGHGENFFLDIFFCCSCRNALNPKLAVWTKYCACAATGSHSKYRFKFIKKIILWTTNASSALKSSDVLKSIYVLCVRSYSLRLKKYNATLSLPN